MKREKYLNPFVGLLIIMALYLLASIWEQNNIQEDQQAQIDCMLKDTEYEY